MKKNKHKLFKEETHKQNVATVSQGLEVMADNADNLMNTDDSKLNKISQITVSISSSLSSKLELMIYEIKILK